MNRLIQWDDEKAKTNYKKHGVLFEVAAQVFDDPLAVSIQDRFENGEERWQTIGLINGHLLLLVAHTLRDADTGEEVIRIISARRPTKQERKRYDHD
jgi:uncharacterized DUF497 family protein